MCGLFEYYFPKMSFESLLPTHLLLYICLFFFFFPNLKNLMSLFCVTSNMFIILFSILHRNVWIFLQIFLKLSFFRIKYLIYYFENNMYMAFQFHTNCSNFSVFLKNMKFYIFLKHQIQHEKQYFSHVPPSVQIFPF